MRPKELSSLLARTIPARLPVLIKGPPGVGKSDIVAQATSAAQADLVISHPVVSDPTDYKGMPAIVEGQAQFLPFGDLRVLIEAERPTVAFLDDLGQAPAVVQAACMQLILARRVNGHALSEQVVFIAATNRREDRAGVTGILEPVKSRFAAIVELTVNVDDWCAWALEHEVPPELIAFIRFRPQLLMSGEATQDIVNRPCPRTVTYLGRLWQAGIEDFEALAGAAGQGFASEFLGFVKVWRSLPSIDQILLDPMAATVPTEPAALYAVAMALVSRLSPKNAPRIMQYANRLPMEFSVLLVRDGLRACPAIAANPAFVRWATKHQEILV